MFRSFRQAHGPGYRATPRSAAPEWSGATDDGHEPGSDHTLSSDDRVFSVTPRSCSALAMLIFVCSRQQTDGVLTSLIAPFWVHTPLDCFAKNAKFGTREPKLLAADEGLGFYSFTFTSCQA